MSNGLMHRPSEGNGFEAGVSRPRAPQTVGQVAEQSRVAGEIQTAMVVARNFPRDEKLCVDRILNGCQRRGLSEKAEYAYSRGGTEIVGPTIALMEHVAACWGNIQYGFRELSTSKEESLIEAYAWDLETNNRRSVTFSVPHKRDTKSGSYPLTDARDVYEHVANFAQRRVRACLEAVLPRDVIEEAVVACRETLAANADTSPAGIQKLVAAFSVLGVTKAQIETRIQRRLDSIQSAQVVSLRRIYQSVRDGMSKPDEWFEVEDAKPSLKEKLKAKSKADPSDAEKVEAAGPDGLLVE